MKNFITYKIVIIFLIVCNNLLSQSSVYKPFPNGYANWNVTRQSMFNLNYYKYQTSGDTLIGAYSYKKVLYCYNTSPGPFNFSPYTFNFAYRNDSISKKVYYLDATGGLNKDTLWYDFNLSIGDTVKSLYSYYNGFNDPRIVQSIDSVLICGLYHKRFKFICTDDASNLIEGVGFMDNFIQTNRGSQCPFEPTYIYTTDFSGCIVNSIKDLVKDDQVELFPNPVNTELIINNLDQITEYALLNSIGDIILKGTLTGTKNIDVSSLTHGLYIIKIQDESGKSFQSKFIKQ